MADAEGNLLLHTANGADITFTKTGENTYQAPTGVYLEIKKVSGGYEVKDKDQTVTFYHHTDLRGIGYVKINTEIRQLMNMMMNSVYQK